MKHVRFRRNGPITVQIPVDGVPDHVASMSLKYPRDSVGLSCSTPKNSAKYHIGRHQSDSNQPSLEKELLPVLRVCLVLSHVKLEDCSLMDHLEVNQVSTNTWYTNTHTYTHMHLCACVWVCVR